MIRSSDMIPEYLQRRCNEILEIAGTQPIDIFDRTRSAVQMLDLAFQNSYNTCYATTYAFTHPQMVPHFDFTKPGLRWFAINTAYELKKITGESGDRASFSEKRSFSEPVSLLARNDLTSAWVLLNPVDSVGHAIGVVPNEKETDSFFVWDTSGVITDRISIHPVKIQQLIDGMKKYFHGHEKYVVDVLRFFPYMRNK